MATNPNPAVPIDAAVQSFGETTAAGSRDTRGRFTVGNPWAPRKGETRNPGGRRKSALLTEALASDLESRIPRKFFAFAASLGLKTNVTFAALIARSMIMQACKSVQAAAEVANRTEGLPTARHEFSGIDGRDIEIRVVYEPESPPKE